MLPEQSVRHEEISIHALREEGDVRFNKRLRKKQISIHALREEGDMQFTTHYTTRRTFLSTPSARRATPTCF